MTKIFKTLYIKNYHGEDTFVHFEKTEDEVFFMTGDLPMIMSPNVEVEDLLSYLGEDTIFPEGTELKTIEITIKDEQLTEEEVSEDRAS
jgi:hypothetical protein